MDRPWGGALRAAVGPKRKRLGLHVFGKEDALDASCLRTLSRTSPMLSEQGYLGSLVLRRGAR